MAELKKLVQGEILFKEEDPSNSMFIVKSGRLIVYQGEGSKYVELGDIGPDEVVGEMAFFDRRPRSASVKAKVSSEVLELSFKSLEAQFDALPNWIQALVKSINAHLRQANDRIQQLESRK
jgi:CRP/FNR family transcriptional regulator, cyclic AMP receptor protein